MVTRSCDGVGGLNAEVCLAFVLNGHRQSRAIVCATDGVDGAAEAAGATILCAAEASARNNAHGSFAHAGERW